MVYNFLNLGSLLKMTRVSRSELDLIRKVTHQKGLIRPKRPSFDIQAVRDVTDLQCALPLISEAELSISGAKIDDFC